VGLDIGTSGVRAAELRLGRGGATLERFGQVALPLGAVRDGEVVDVAVVAGRDQGAVGAGEVQHQKVVVGVANQKVVVRQVDLPWLPLKELRQGLAFQVQDYIPMPVEHAILDVHPLEEFTNDAGRPDAARLLVAASRGDGRHALQAVTQAGSAHHGDLTPSRCSGRRSPRAPASRSRRGASSTSAPASPTSSSTRAACRASCASCSWAAATSPTRWPSASACRPTRRVHQAAHRTVARPEPGGGHPANRAIESTGGAFVEEVRGSLDYYLAQPGAARIGRVVLSGGGSRLHGLVERLTAATRLPVEVAHPMSVLKIGKTGLTPEQLSYVEPMVTVPVGLALGVAS
jgi:type IV pilus assembly protein PilM